MGRVAMSLEAYSCLVNHIKAARGDNQIVVPDTTGAFPRGDIGLAVLIGD
jgi:hypothetical protein